MWNNSFVRICNCGSGLESRWEYDAQGIEITRACSKCISQKLSAYRPEILSGYTQADIDEPIDNE